MWTRSNYQETGGPQCVSFSPQGCHRRFGASATELVLFCRYYTDTVRNGRYPGHFSVDDALSLVCLAAQRV